MVRAFILFFALGSLAVFILPLSFASAGPHAEMEKLARQFESEPTPHQLRKLLRYPAQSAASYYQMALVGAAFARHPEVFQVVAEGSAPQEELGMIQILATSGTEVFQYHPELKPREFDRVFQGQNWLARFRPPSSAKQEH